ncbi:hypothetical protein [Nocardia cyriacigeorgica]|uniref:hypothetical protein n=1 Tax=Nocardia cyriacigeorgica TaxID=135487 RepID=UPI002457C295|nr:hypothetical protein [Nocardia cyriacigeorgica]
MNQPVIETPVMGIPREDTMRMALAARTLSGVLRQLRERRGRSAWDDAENAARKNAVLDRHTVNRFSRADAEEWNTAEREGRIRAERHPDTGMTIRVAPLSRGRFGVQAGWEDNHAEAVFGSEDLAARVADWLRADGSADAVDDLRRNVEDMHATSRPRQQRTLRDIELAEARKWAQENDADWYRWWELSYTNADTIDGRRLDEAEIINKWVDATGGTTRSAVGVARRWLAEHDPEWTKNWVAEYDNCDTRDGRRSLEAEIVRRWRAQSRAGRGRGGAGQDQGADAGAAEQGSGPQDQRTPTPLADRLRGRVPDRVLDDPRWHVAEAQFAVLTSQGADPDTLIESVAAIDFNNGQIRAPSGFAAWAMREAAKKGKAANAHTRSEEDARRSVAEEWLMSADPGSPFDRARAAQLVGEIDDDFDALLARKYPGILDGDAEQARARAAQHESNADTADDQARKDNAAAKQTADEDEAEDTVFVVDSDGTVITVPFVPAPEPPPEAEAEAASHAADADREHEAADREHEADSQHRATRTAEAAAQAPLTPPKQAKTNAKTRRRTPPPAKPAATHTRNRGRAH